MGVEDVDMTWVVEPAYSRSEVNRAARLLSDRRGAAGPEMDHNLTIVNNWRAAHYWPLNAATVTLKRKAELVYKPALVSRRIKRLPSIQAKLQRFPNMTLSQMQDIGGCRGVVSTVTQVERLKRLYTKKPISAGIQRVDDYIDAPRDSGYRSVHLIYKYQGPKPAWAGLKIEIQLRTRRMHAWATAVEIVGAFSQQALKSSHGDKDWLTFFQLMSSAIARIEGTNAVPSTPRGEELNRELRGYVARLRVPEVLNGYRMALRATTSNPRGAHWFVMVLDWNTRRITRTGYTNRLLEDAQDHYVRIERQANPAVDVVLVSVDRARTLSRAYPNYYLDAQVFIDLLREADVWTSA